jgi:glycosyltransferase involved in cell wall biosynthesis
MIESTEPTAATATRVSRPPASGNRKAEPLSKRSAQRPLGRLRIAQVVTAMDCGGVPDHIVNLARGLSQRHDVSVICREADPQYAVALAKAGIEVIHVPFKRAPNPLSDIRAFWSLVTILRQRRFDVVHTHRSKAALLGLLAARIARVPITVNTAHMFGFMIIRHALGRGVFWIYDKLLFAIGADAVITVSESIRSAVLAGHLVPERKVRRVYYGIEYSPLVPTIPPAGLRASLGLGDDETIVIVVARHVPQKGLDMLIESAARVVSAFPRTRFLLVGDGPLRRGLEQQAIGLGLANQVLFLGERSDVAKLLQLADIFALSSVAEGLPIAILEAMAAGKPVVATGVDGVPEAVSDGETGYVVCSRDPAEMASALGRLIADPALRKRLGRAGRMRLEREFSLERMTANMEALYRGLGGGLATQVGALPNLNRYMRDVDAA